LRSSIVLILCFSIASRVLEESTSAASTSASSGATLDASESIVRVAVGGILLSSSVLLSLLVFVHDDLESIIVGSVISLHTERYALVSRFAAVLSHIATISFTVVTFFPIRLIHSQCHVEIV